MPVAPTTPEPPAVVTRLNDNHLWLTLRGGGFPATGVPLSGAQATLIARDVLDVLPVADVASIVMAHLPNLFTQSTPEQRAQFARLMDAAMPSGPGHHGGLRAFLGPHGDDVALGTYTQLTAEDGTRPPMRPPAYVLNGDQADVLAADLAAVVAARRARANAESGLERHDAVAEAGRRSVAR